MQLNREKFLERKFLTNEKRRIQAKLFTKQWKLKNPEKRNALEANRRATKLQRTPSWANYEDIKMFYEVANVLSRGGVLFHVDHIIPLKGKEVCGLHSHDNLQVLPWFENLRKSAKLKEKNT